MQVRLFVTNDKSNVKKVVLRSDTTIGRSSECNLRIASQEVSRQHCTILVAEDHVAIRDHGSSNGTIVNGEMIEPNRDVPLATDSAVEIGNVRFRVEHEIEIAAAAPVESPAAVVAAPVAQPIAASPAPIVAQPVQPPEDPPAEEAEFDGQETIRDIHADETLNEHTALDDPGELSDEELSDAETVNKLRPEFESPTEPGPEDTIAFDFSGGAMPEAEDPPTDIYDDSQIEAFKAEVPEPDETVSMNVGEFDFTPPVAEPAASPPAPSSAEESPKKKSGLKSLFGFFGRKKKAKTEASSKTEQIESPVDSIDTDATLPDDPTMFAGDDVPDEERTVAEESFAEPADDIGDTLDATLQMPEGFDEEEEFEDEAVEEEEDEAVEEEAVAGEQITVFPDGEPAADEVNEEASGEDTDEHLNDFFKQLAQE